MTAEDLVQKHFGEDIREPAFWQKAIDVVKSQLENFRQLLPS
jgi:oligoendopeptidase F